MKEIGKKTYREYGADCELFTTLEAHYYIENGDLFVRVQDTCTGEWDSLKTITVNQLKKNMAITRDQDIFELSGELARIIEED